MDHPSLVFDAAPFRVVVLSVVTVSRFEAFYQVVVTQLNAHPDHCEDSHVGLAQPPRHHKGWRATRNSLFLWRRGVWSKVAHCLLLSDLRANAVSNATIFTVDASAWRHAVESGWIDSTSRVGSLTALRIWRHRIDGSRLVAESSA
jgi:hypothetical protein